MIRIAFASNNKNDVESDIAQHFGRCPFYTFIDVKNKSIKNVLVIENPYFNNHETGIIPEFIKENKVNIIVSGGMGKKAVEIFLKNNINVVTGISGKIEDALKLYFKNKLSGYQACSQNSDTDHCL